MKWKPVRYWLEWRAAQAAYGMVSLLPRSCVNPLAMGLGWLAYLFDVKDRRIALENLAFAYGAEKTPQEIRQIGRRSLQNFTRVLMDSFWCRNLTFDNIDRYVRFDPEGLALYDSLVARGRGVILIGMHHGNWEWMSLSIGFKKRPVNIVVQRLALDANREGFDLIVATNILVYYDAFEQGLALANLTRMLRPGGLLLSNNAVPEVPGMGIRSVGYRTTVYSDRPDDGDHIVWYQKIASRNER